MDASRSNASPEPDAPGALLTGIARFSDLHFPYGSRLVVAYSGGLDSTVLLHLIHRIATARGLTLSALHVHHGLSEHADDWQAHCQTQCAQLGVLLRVERVTVSRAGQGIEAAARAARYAVFASVDADCLLLAQHADDQAETLLLNLVRGAGLAGAAAIPLERALARCVGHGATLAENRTGEFPAGSPLRLLRPVLSARRTELAAYARVHDLAYVEDASNADVRLTRNFLRHEILPALERHRPGVAATLARAATRFGEASELADALADIDLRGCAAENGRLSLPALRELTPTRRANALRRALVLQGVQLPSAARLESLVEQIAQVGEGARACVKFGSVEARIWRGLLFWQRPQNVPAMLPLAVSETSWANPCPWAGGVVGWQADADGGISKALLAAGGELRARAGGERLKLFANRPEKGLKAWFQEFAVPPWQRERAPVLWLGGRVAWVGGLGVDQGMMAPPGLPGVLPVWDADDAGVR